MVLMRGAPPRTREKAMLCSARRLASEQTVLIANVFLALLACAPPLLAVPAYVRVNQAGYETGGGTFRAYLMSPVPETGATFQVINSKGGTAHTGRVGALLGKWGHNRKVSYNVYALDFNAPGRDLYTIKVSGPKAATSPAFAVDSSAILYSGLLLNSLFFYETERDGAD